MMGSEHTLGSAGMYSLTLYAWLTLLCLSSKSAHYRKFIKGILFLQEEFCFFNIHDFYILQISFVPNRLAFNSIRECSTANGS